MHISNFGTACAVSAIAILASLPAHAQFTELPQIVVTPNRAPTDATKTGSRVETVSREEIEEKSQPLVIDYLDRLPGISISTPGGPGGEGSLSVRGAPRRYVKTLYNGIDISDPTSPQVQTSYQYLLSSGIDTIEVLKGSQSTLYGSDAIAGVIGLSTLGDIEPGVTHLLHGEGGSFGTARGSYGLRAANEDAKAAINIAGFRTDGISAAAAGSERDGYENVTFDAAGEYRVNEAVSVFGSLLYIDAKAEYDEDFASPPADDPLGINRNLSRQVAGRAGFNVDLLDGRLRNQFSVQAFNIDRRIRSASAFGPFDADYGGRRTKFDYQGAFDANDWLTLQYGADHEQQDARITDNFGTDTDNDFSLTGVWGQIVAEPVAGFVFTGGLRHDSHSEFGSYTTYRATGSYEFDTGTRIHSSLGTGFRAPSLYELFAPPSFTGGPSVGDPTLQPETSVSFDVGVEQRLLDDRAVLDVTFFYLDIDDLIVNNVGTGFTYEQTDGTSKQRGVEASVIYDVNEWLALGAAYTYTSTRDANGNRTVRVPRHEIGLSAAYRPAEKWTISADAKIAVDTVDAGAFELDDYVLVNAKVAYQATESTEFYVRAENLLDQDYQTVRGYNTPGFGAFAGFKSRF
ncbi:MAG: TonB-dependent receptor plug domain-containing protein [Aliihoeflea sp.]|uniref:TonB-dependent receptor plug domain-containing protein n=1 Tax=Aliihoeflea sp. TaxID=2608088 RepID=UPI004033E6AB